MNTETIMLTLAGSRLYGTNREDSDYDVRGVMLDPIESLIGLDRFEQQTHRYFVYKDIKSDDAVIYGLKKFFALCLNANPNIIELLFCNPLYKSEFWDDIVENRNLFLSNKIIHTFSGYAFSQLKRIRVRKNWAERPPQKPNPKDFGMSVDKKGGAVWENVSLKDRYNNLLLDYNNYIKWVTERNPARRELEEKYGYDTKHACNLYRLFYEAEELLLTGNLNFPLKKSGEILDVLNGKYDYAKVVNFAENFDKYLRKLEPFSGLPHKPDRKGAQKLLIRMYMDYFYTYEFGL